MTVTKREAEILNLLADGKTFEEIAKILSLAKGTVSTHVWNLEQKLDMRRSVQLVAWWISSERKEAA